MSFDPEPTNYEYSPAPKHCPACFDVGQSPKTLFICLTGILRGDLAIPADPDPPNGVWEIEVSAGCAWSETKSGYTFDWQPSPAPATLTVTDATPRTFFNGTDALACAVWFANTNVNPAITKYYGGHAIIVPPLLGGIYSAALLLSLLNLNPSSGLWMTPRGKSGEESVTTISRGQDATNIHIKYDHS